MTEGLPAVPARNGMRAALAANLDLTFAGIAGIAFVAAEIIHPTALCGSGAHPSALFTAFGWTSAVGFLLASFLAFVSRKHIAAKIGLFLVGLFVTLVTVIALVVAASPTGLGFADSDGEHPTMQSQLRILAKPPAAGKHAYWLGAHFRKASVASAQGYWSPDTELEYSHIDEHGAQDIYILVRSYRRGATDESADGSSPSQIVHTGSGQDVRITFQQPRTPDAAIIAEARAAVQAIPEDVEYSGCD
jgi:hypothetical protein